jgi:hypothetical protein
MPRGQAKGHTTSGRGMREKALILQAKWSAIIPDRKPTDPRPKRGERNTGEAVVLE